MTYAETLSYLYQQLPMFQRVGPKAFKKDLKNITRLCSALGNPQGRFSSVHIAGTNGKGSVSSMLASILQEAGYKIGLYTSPHLRSFTERIRINGQPIPEEGVISFVERNRSVIEEIKPSFFEVTVAMAFQHFADEEVDLAVIEVGLGGRLDSTNIIEPILGAVTSISYDHMAFLGDTLAKIAGEKAGIFKKGRTFVIGEDLLQTRPVFEAKAEGVGAKLVFAEERYSLGGWKRGITSQMIAFHRYMSPVRIFRLNLGGDYQYPNMRTALCLVDELRELNYSISEEHIAAGLLRVKENTGFRGRMTVLANDPMVLTDVGHNLAGVREVLKAFGQLEYDQLHMVWGMVFDKDPNKILEMLPKNAKYYFVKPDVPRGMDASELASKAAAYGLHGETWPSVQAGLDAAQQAASKSDLIFVGGSTFVVAEVV